MDSSNIWLYVSLVVLIMLSAFFSATETAFSSVNRIRLKNYAEEGNKRAVSALKIVDNYDRALSAILIGNNVVNIASASIGTLLFTELLGPSGVGISTAVMTVLVLIFGEILPKSFAKDNAETFALLVAKILSALMFLLYPIISVFVKLKSLISKKSSTNERAPTVTEQELKVIIEEIEDEGVLKQDESELLQSALEFDDITADEIFTPRVDMVAIDVNEDTEHIREIFLNEKYSRVPVYDKSIDNIIGILNEREFLREYLNNKDVNIKELLREPIFIHEQLRISTLLKQLQKSKSQLAIVTDQYGGVVGLITMEDILEELVGEIYDEDDEIEQNIIKTGDNKYLVRGDYNIYDLFEFLGYNDRFFETKYNTVSGWAIENFEKLPMVGESFEYAGQIKVTVEKVDDKRITMLLVEFTPKIIIEE